MTTLDTVISNLIRAEGGYVNSAADRGGATKYGITQKSWDGYRKGAAPSSVKDITPEMARLFYVKYASDYGIPTDGPSYLVQFLFDVVSHSGYAGLSMLRKGLPPLLAALGLPSGPSAGWEQSGPLALREWYFLSDLPTVEVKLALWVSKILFWLNGVKKWLQTHPKGSAARGWKYGSQLPPGLKPSDVNSPGFHPVYLRGWINRSLDPLFWGNDLKITVPVIRLIVSGMSKMAVSEGVTDLDPDRESFLREYPFKEEVFE